MTSPPFLKAHTSVDLHVYSDPPAVRVGTKRPSPHFRQSVPAIVVGVRKIWVLILLAKGTSPDGVLRGCCRVYEAEESLGEWGSRTVWNGPQADRN